MKLYKISQKVNKNWDTYDSAVVCAKNADDAKRIRPTSDRDLDFEKALKKRDYGYDLSDWCDMKDVQVEYIGEAGSGMKRGVIVASFNSA